MPPKAKCGAASLSQPQPPYAAASTTSTTCGIRAAQVDAALAASGGWLRQEELAGRGRCLVAARAAKVGDVLLVEAPTVHFRTPDNEATVSACGWCTAPLGSVGCRLREQLAHMTEGHSLETLTPCGEEAPRGVHPRHGAASGACCCEHCKDVWYCSAEHRELHRAATHGAFCSSSKAHRTAAGRFRDW
jgi:hypothetical protein